MIRRRQVLVVLAGAAAVLGAGPLAVPGAAGAWAVAAARVAVPGLGALSAAGPAEVLSVSCASAGNCAAGGRYDDQGQGFVVSQRNGAWHRAIEVPGLAALNSGGFAAVYSVSCGSAGSCAAGGYYHDRSGHAHGFVVSQRHGVWHRAIEVPGLAALSAGGQARVFSVSCGSAGNCAAGGDYQVTSGEVQRGFVVSQRNGVWGRAFEVPGLAALGGFAFLNSVSCASAGNCAAGGDDSDDGGPARGFVVSQRHGVWRKAIEVPALAALSGLGYAEVVSVSCASAGNCAAGGTTPPARVTARRRATRTRNSTRPSSNCGGAPTTARGLSQSASMTARYPTGTSASATLRNPVPEISIAEPDASDTVFNPLVQRETAGLGEQVNSLSTRIDQLQAAAEEQDAENVEEQTELSRRSATKRPS